MLYQPQQERKLRRDMCLQAAYLALGLGTATAFACFCGRAASFIALTRQKGAFWEWCRMSWSWRLLDLDCTVASSSMQRFGVGDRETAPEVARNANVMTSIERNLALPSSRLGRRTGRWREICRGSQLGFLRLQTKTLGLCGCIVWH